MGPTIYPCFWFAENGSAAAAFYTSLFNDAGIVQTNTMVTTFRIGEKRYMCLNGGTTFSINPSLSMFVYCDNVEETNLLWEKLIKGGSALMEINQYPWSERYGWLKDKFGLTWQISVVNPGETKSIRPCLLFTTPVFGKAEEAIRFYTHIFKDSAISNVMQYAEGDVNAGKVLYAECKIGGYDLIAMDGPGNHAYTFNEAVSLVVSCETQEEIDYYWSALSKEGEEQMCGWLKDRFGVSWQIVPRILGDLMNNPERSSPVVQALMPMKKISIQKLLDA